MSEETCSLLKTCFEETAERNGDDEFMAFVHKILDLKAEITNFVLTRRGGGGSGTYVGFLKGSFNLSYRIRFSDGGPDALIRFPKPGHTTTALRDEKVINEVHVMEYIRQNTTIPVPRIHSWGLTAESPHQLGPFIIMDYVDGTLLTNILKDPNQEQGAVPVLNPNIDDMVLDKTYLQIADYMLQLSQLTFIQIGAISKDDASNSWSVTGRPLTYNMNELASCTSYPVDQFPTTSFDRASDYFRAIAKEHLTHLWTQRNLADTPEIAQQRFIARHRFEQLIPKYCIKDTGPFILFCDDMRPANMLVDPETLRITGVIDFEYTNAMPAQFAYDPPWWLLLDGPERWLDRCALDEFLTLYKPRMEQFLRALEQVEEEPARKMQLGGFQLSTRMRDSWKSGRFWFDYASRKGFELDSVYWAALHEGSSSGVELLDDKACAEIESFKETKMRQLKAYYEECTARFSSKEE